MRPKNREKYRRKIARLAASTRKARDAGKTRNAHDPAEPRRSYSRRWCQCTYIRRRHCHVQKSFTFQIVLLAVVVFGPQLFGIQTYGILTGSMEPAIQTGALTFVDTGVTGADLRPGDVAAFDIGEGRICTHRVVSVDPENQTITTKGDANATEDLNPVAFEDVFGKTVGSVPGLGAALISFTENRVVWLLAIGGVTAFLLVLSCALPDKKPSDE